jgi:beta-lactamase superfamily II metal-dependent hydrolase
MMQETSDRVDAIDRSLLRVIVLDVGHGNCAIVQDGTEVAVVDAPKTTVLPLCLEMQSAPTVRHLILSHADEDHIGGAQALLAHSDISIQQLWINPNSIQHSKTYLDLLTVARDRHLAQDLKVSTNLNVGAGENLSFGRVKIEILHPDILYAGIGPTGSSHPLGRITSNGMSSVLRISLADLPAVLLPGDMDAAAFDVLASSGSDLTAPVLVFPHHGGSSGSGDDRDLAIRLCDAVRPELIVFSIGRRRYANPTPEVIAGIRASVPGAHVACTQLSKRCNNAELDSGVFDHVLADVPAAGRTSGLSCAGSVVVDWTSDGIVYRPLRTNHQLFIETHVASPLCGVQATLKASL